MKRTLQRLNKRQVTQDELVNILWHADAEEIKQLCTINRAAHAMCQQNRWQDKFKAYDLPSFTKTYTLFDFITMSKLKQQAEDMFFVMSERDIVYLLFVYPDDVITYDTVRFTPKWVHLICEKKSYHDFIMWLMKLIYNKVDIRDNECGGVSYHPSILRCEQKDSVKARERLDLYAA